MKALRFIPSHIPFRLWTLIAVLFFAFGVGLVGSFLFYDDWVAKDQTIAGLKETVVASDEESASLSAQLAAVKQNITALKNEDQYKRNESLSEEISAIQKTYDRAVSTYEDLLDLKLVTNKTAKLDDLFTQVLSELSKRDYKKADQTITDLSTQILALKIQLTPTATPAPSIPPNNSPPGSGYSRQRVAAIGSQFTVDIIAGDLSTTRVLVDTASDHTCTNDCPVLALGDYVSRNGAYAGVNGAYFCPATYPTCVDKKNSFDTLLMNKNKVYFNSDNNVYSTVPAVIFLGSSVRFVARSLEWGRDTGIDSMIANQGLLVSGGNAVYAEDGDPKKGSKGNRSFVANKGNTIFIGVVQNATVGEVAQVLKTMGMDNGLNLDSGGSTALWFGGYKYGPGRGLPNAIVFVKR